MLDTTTKKRIDDCRDILVGKLPDPKAQIEQITIALIYKFMDDMDKEAIELGAKAKFFSGSFEKYSWDNLFDTKVTANEMLSLYSDAIASMDKNPNIPQLFRDIFKNAFLPYRDPETLKLFLKTIGEFEYTHSEKLGDAFEYLLSVMGSQGDAGQFRTPRHIIDFLVAVVDPSKTDTILDPACGTAGFLISAFKHIKEKNNYELTPDERKRLIQNFVGYDISPDMVRLSLVNLYLHGFSDPDIHEYDTLTSEDRWSETFDVILANPPFMSPKGGIRPHKKFSISSNRSEVLFVDYIAEHLNSNGRAGIVVPNGILANTQTAFKQLRKLLIQDCLLAVISLPAGCFNPYSGVKTSILVLDKLLAKKSDNILFIKVENDGFDLGAQRNTIDENDLPAALKVVTSFKESIRNESSFSFNASSLEVKLTEKKALLKSADILLTKDKFKPNENLNSSKYEIVKLDTVCKFKRGPFGGSLKKEIFVNQGYLVYEQYHAINNDFSFGRYYITEEKYNEMRGFKVFPNDLLISCSGTMGKIAIVPKDASQGIINQALLKLTPNIEKINPFYLKKILESENIQSIYFRDQEGAAIQNVASVKVLKDIEIPLPSIEIQNKIVAEIEEIQVDILHLKSTINQKEMEISNKINEVWGKDSEQEFDMAAEPETKYKTN